jgi:hypothetical protein
MLRASLKYLWLWPLVIAPLSLAQADKTSVIPLVSTPTWRLAKSQDLDLEGIQKYGGDPVIEREYGVRSPEDRVYRLENTMAEVIVEPASDASAAYGLLTFYRTASMIPETGMQLAFSGPDGVLMARGHLFFRVPRPGDSKLSENDFRSLLVFLAGTRPSSDVTTELPVSMPTTGLILGSERYLLGLEAARRVLPSFRTDLIGFAQGAEAQVATYASGMARPTVLAITYPTPQIARLRFGLMQKLLGVNQESQPRPPQGKRMGSFVFLVLNSNSAATTKNLLDQFKVSDSVSWDKPYPGNKPFAAQLAQLYLANFALVLIVIGFAVAAGFLVVFIRRLLGKLFPDSVWGRREEGGIITLSLR